MGIDIGEPRKTISRLLTVFQSPLIGGISWLTTATIVTRIVSFVSQIILAALLSKEDFGLFAVTLSVVAITNSVADAGLDALLIQRGQRQYNETLPIAFWVGLTFNTLIAAILIMVGPLIDKTYGDPRISAMVRIVALTYVVQAAGNILLAKLSVDMAFKRLALITIITSVFSDVLTTILAWLGFGPYSFIIPLPLTQLLNGIVLYFWTRLRPWAYGFHFKEWGTTIRSAIWIVLGQGATALLQNGDYIALGLLVPVGTLGVYFFAYELVAQVGAIFAQNVYKVLFPILVKVGDTPNARTQQMLNGLRLIMVVSSFLSISIAVGIDPLSALTGWQARFPGIVVVVRMLAFFFPLRMLEVNGRSAMMARGRFRLLALIVFLQGVGLFLTAGLSALVFKDAIEPISLMIGIYLGGSSVAFLIFCVTDFDLTKFELLKSIGLTWFASIGAGVLAIVVSDILPFGVSKHGSTIGLIIQMGVSLIVFFAAFAGILLLFPEYRQIFQRLRRLGRAKSVRANSSDAVVVSELVPTSVEESAERSE